MKLKMFVYGGQYLIPIRYDNKPYFEKDWHNNLLSVGVWIQPNNYSNIFVNKSLKRRWNKIEIETPYNVGIVNRELFSISEIYSPTYEEVLSYYYPEYITKLKLVSPIYSKTCFISSNEVRLAI
jgi:hypothetical protein